MRRTSVLLLFGGESPEHEVSLASARNVYAAIDDSSYDVQPVYIAKDGKWWLTNQITEVTADETVRHLAPVPGSGSFVTLPDYKIIRPDVIFPVLHGRGGEDGSVQGLAELLHIPVVGCDMTASAVGMDKLLTKRIWQAAGLPVVPYETYAFDMTIPDFVSVASRLDSDVLFVKPTRTGSSIGVSRATDDKSLSDAIVSAHQFDREILIEKGIQGRELEIAVLGNPPDFDVSPIGEIRPNAEFYDYETKYSATSRAEVIVPAQLENGTAERISLLARQAYTAIRAAGMARIDFFLSDDGQIYLNEINTIPGFTNISMYPKLWHQAGLSYTKLINRLIELALMYNRTKQEGE